MYTFIQDLGETRRDSDGKVVVPPEFGASDPNFIEYQEWANLGNHPRIIQSYELPDYVPPVIVPDVVTPVQIRLALNQLGLRKSVEDYVSAANYDIQDMWQYSLEYRRDNVYLLQVASQLGISVDDVFILAATL